MDIVNELTTYRIVMEFISEQGAPVTPTAGTYRIDDVISDSVILDSTPFTPSGSQHVLVVDFSDNRIVDTDNTLEERIISVVAQYGTGKQCTGEYRYKVRNLAKVE